MSIPHNAKSIKFERLRRLAYWLRQSVTKGQQLDIVGWKISGQLRDAETLQQANEAETNYRKWKRKRHPRMRDGST